MKMLEIVWIEWRILNFVNIWLIWGWDFGSFLFFYNEVMDRNWKGRFLRKEIIFCIIFLLNYLILVFMLFIFLNKYGYLILVYSNLVVWGDLI